MGPDVSLTPELIQAQTFTSAFRGYDAAEVKAFLVRVANEMRAWRERAEGLESAWHSAEERAARPPVLDEDTLMAAVGEETAAILRTARAAAAEMRAKAAEESDRTVAEAREEAERALSGAREEAERALSEARTEAERTLSEARFEANQLKQEAEAVLAAATAAAEEQAAALLAKARQEATEVLDRAGSEANDIRAQAEKERQLTIEGAHHTRDRILEDLSRRRRVATVQIEQLRAGRERLIESYAIVRRTLEEVQSELSRADAEARAAADEVGRRLRDEPEVELTEAARPVSELLLVAGGPAETGSASEPAGPAGDETDDEAVDEAVGTAGGSGEAADEQGGPGGSAVDELFARIRATRAAAGSGEGADPLADEPPSERPDGDDWGEAASAGEEAAGAVPAPAGAAGAGAVPAPEVGAGPVGTGSGGGDSVGTGSGGGDSVGTGSGGGDSVGTGSGGSGDDTVTAGGGVADGERRGVAGGPAARGRRGSKKRSAQQERSNGRLPAPSGAAKPGPTVRLIEAPAPAEESPAEAGEEAAVVAAASERGGDMPVSDGDESLLQAREFAVVDLETSLTRRLKRALQDEQNDVLDRLRNLKDVPSAERLLPDTDTQIARYADAARPLLADAAGAGAVFTDETLGVPGRDAPVEVDVADLAAECGSGIVSPLRRRLEQAIEIGSGEDQAVLVESLGAAYREWKTQRIERLAGDVLSAAFSRGTWAAAPAGAHLRWVVEDADGPCPDCDDDALAGDIPKGEAFPTGQHHPPAHSGCRCLLVPSLPAG